MGKIFEKLLISNSLLTEEELQYYKKLQELAPQKHLGEILLEHGLIEKDILQQLINAEIESKKNKEFLKEQKRDKKVLEVVQQIGIVEPKEIAECIKEKNELEKNGKTVFLVDLLIQHKYLTPYLVKKFYRKGNARIPLPEGVHNYEDLVSSFPQYLQDRFLAKVILKNHIIPKIHMQMCWDILKRNWPCKSLSEIIQEKNLLTHRKLKTLLHVVKEQLPKQYPFLNSQISDTYLAKLLVRRNFLSPWRINKCLADQLIDVRKTKVYIPLRKILVDRGYLTDYQFDVVLKQYGLLVSLDKSEHFVPTDEITLLTKEQIPQAIQDAQSDVHLILDQDDDLMPFATPKSNTEDSDVALKDESSSQELDEIESGQDLMIHSSDFDVDNDSFEHDHFAKTTLPIEEYPEDEMHSSDEQDPEHLDSSDSVDIESTAGRTGSFVYTPEAMEGMITSPTQETIIVPDENTEEHADWMDLEVENEELDIAISPQNVQDFIKEDLTTENLEEKAQHLSYESDEDIFDDDEDSTEECDVDDLIAEDLV